MGRRGGGGSEVPADGSRGTQRSCRRGEQHPIATDTGKRTPPPPPRCRRRCWAYQPRGQPHDQEHIRHCQWGGSSFPSPVSPRVRPALPRKSRKFQPAPPSVPHRRALIIAHMSIYGNIITNYGPRYLIDELLLSQGLPIPGPPPHVNPYLHPHDFHNHDFLAIGPGPWEQPLPLHQRRIPPPSFSLLLCGPRRPHRSLCRAPPGQGSRVRLPRCLEIPTSTWGCSSRRCRRA